MAHLEGSSPYPWPYDGDDGPLDARRLALVVTGAQARWFGSARGATVLERIERSAALLRAAGVLVIWTRHARRHPGTAARRYLPEAGGPGSALVAEIAAGDVVIDAPGCDAYFGTDLDLTLRTAGCDRLALAGLAAEVLVDGTLRSANDRGYECVTLADAVCPHDPLTGERTLVSTTMSGGIFGAVGSTDALLAAHGVPALEVHR